MGVDAMLVIGSCRSSYWGVGKGRSVSKLVNGAAKPHFRCFST